MFQYYFLASLLPASLTLGQQPDIAFWEFIDLCKENLHESDLAQTETMKRYVDINNLRPFWQQKEIDPHGNYTFKEMETHLMLEEGFPDYVFEFLDEYEDIEHRLSNFPKLLGRFFAEEIPQASGFLKNFLTFERNWRLIMVALRAKTFNRNLERELQYEDPQDELVEIILQQKDLPEFTPPEEFMDLKKLYDELKLEPLKLFWEMGQWRLSKIESLLEGSSFSIDNILRYLAQLIIVENWLKLNHDQGINIVENIMKEQQA